MKCFNSQIRLGSKINDFTENQVKNEPMLFSCCWDAAMQLGGPITRCFLNKLREDNVDFVSRSDFIFDSRVHMLFKNWYPCIPGYHHDDVLRSGLFNQPNYELMNSSGYTSEHAMCLVNGDICPTEFAIGRELFSTVPEGEIVYKQWHKEVIEHLNKGRLEKKSAPSNQIIYFNCETWHQGVKAVSNGWRWFGRASIKTTRKPSNEIRRQVQVYLENPMEGW
jgi:hypothetical protein